jgi:hypothetical protein
MGLHRNARLGLAGRRALVADIEAGCSCEYCHLAGDEAGRLVAPDPPLNCAGRKPNGLPELAQRPAGVLMEEREQVMID